jgi:hypothetical protein
MFDMFKSSKEDYHVPTPTPLIDSVKVPSNGYTVGLDDENNTVLKLHVGAAYTTMTLSPTGTRQLIRMLEATLPESDDWK